MDLLMIHDVLRDVADGNVKDMNGESYSPEAIASCKEVCEAIDRVWKQGFEDGRRS